MRIHHALLPVIIALVFFMPLAAFAFDIGNSAPDDPLAPARTAIADKDWAKAIYLLKGQTAKDPQNSDAFNLLGFSQRNSGDLQSALINYKRALAINPDHKGAHEYLGETYLKLHDLPKAQAEQVQLQTLCPEGCEELNELNHAIALYRADPAAK